MMIHEKLLTGQFLLDLKNDRPSLLHSQHSPHLPRQARLVPQVNSSQLDIYSAYAYQQQLQQQMINGHRLPQHELSPQPYDNNAPEVLDLSRRFDAVEAAAPKSDSPLPSNFSTGYSSPAGSPPINGAQQPQQLAANPFTSPQNTQPKTSLELATSLYPTLYYANVKHGHTTPPPLLAFNAPLLAPASAAAAAAPVSRAQMPVALPPAPHSPIFPISSPPIAASSTPSRNSSSSSQIVNDVMPIPAIASLPPQDAKTTRPFKAFPRDPLVIAATFAATDVLLDNPRGERYTEYRKRMLQQIRKSNGGFRTVTNPKMRRTNSCNGSVHEGSSSNHNSESDERNPAEESSDCDSNAGNFIEKPSGEKLTCVDAAAAAAAAAATATAATATAAATAAAANNSFTATTTSNGNQIKDAAYYERRRKNNAAAKKSRDRRRIKEDEIAIRAAYLERQNIELLCQIDTLKAQLAAFVSKNSA